MDHEQDVSGGVEQEEEEVVAVEIRLLSHLLGLLHSITGRIPDLRRRLGVDFVIQLKQTKETRRFRH